MDALRALRARLDGLNYREHVDPSSASLVQQLLHDLLQAREECERTRHQSGRHATDLAGAEDKVSTCACMATPG